MRTRCCRSGEPPARSIWFRRSCSSLTGVARLLVWSPSVCQRWHNSSDLQSFLHEFSDLLTRVASSSSSAAGAAAAPSLSSLPSADFLSLLARHVEQLPGGWGAVKALDENTCRDMTLALV